MPWRAVLIGLFLALSALPMAAGQSFPYRAVITADDVYVRSGPGQNYYATEKLHHGDTVEVYRHDPGGWYAIRPTPQSFSWVSGRYLRMAEGNLAVIANDGVVARVGSSLTDARDVWQVKFRRGEEVEVLEHVSTATGDWVKIAPPAGEFRWVAGKFVERDDSPAAARRAPRATGGLLSALASDMRNEDHDAPGSDQRPRHGDSRSASQSGGPAARNSPRSRGEAAPAEDHGLDDAAYGLDDRDFAGSTRELDDIESALSSLVCHEDVEYDYAELARWTEDALAEAATPQERSRARRLLQRIARFEELEEQQRQLDEELESAVAEAPTAPRVTARHVAAGEETQDAPFDATAIAGRFDAAGKLLPMQTRRLGGPQYVLVDDRGRPKAFVSPAPGVNLRPYHGCQVGVSGVRGYSTELQGPLVTAQRVEFVGNTIRR
jgi:uncharacterized protein YgiM (DUF1202 family)